MTTAQKIARRYADDGMQWRDDDGIPLQTALEDAGATLSRDPEAPHDIVRYDLPDGSAIVCYPTGWDIGYPHCYCMRGAGHADECPERSNTTAGYDSAGQWTPAQYAIDAGWDYTQIEATAEHGVADADRDALSANQADALLAYCKRRIVAERIAARRAFDERATLADRIDAHTERSN